MSRSTILMLAAATALGGCAGQGGGASSSSSSSAAASPVAVATLVDASGADRGTARFTAEPGGGLRLAYEGSGLPAGVHGIHVHAVGKCDAPDFTSAGPHWNPTTRKHGTEAPDGPHGGDLPNLTAGADGSARFEAPLAGATLPGLMDADGAALVVHAAADDYRTDPSGNSGGRIACGVIRPA